MSTPAGTTLVTITGTRLDPSNKPRSGVLVFTLEDDVSGDIDGVSNEPVRVRLNNGALSVQLLAPTNHTTYPVGWLYRIDEWLDKGDYKSYSVYLTDADPSIDLDSLDPVASPVSSSKYATKAELDDLRTRMSATFVQYDLTNLITWSHNLGYRPAITFVDSTNESVIPGIEHVDENTVKLHFGSPTNGRVFAS